MKNKIFAFWESPNNIMPAYLELCKITWQMNIPNVEINILNYSNLHLYIDGIYDLQLLKKIPLAMQSDIISAAVLEKFGGIFIDLDCIITENIFEYFSQLPEDKLIGFGYPNKGIHLAVLYAKKPNNRVLSKWRECAQEKLKNLPDKYNWDFFGNSIINPMIQSEEYKDDFLIIDRTESGNILESKMMLNSNWKNANEFYKNFYFNPNFLLKDSIIENVKFGIISLHNSWSPDYIKKEYSIKGFLQYDLPIVEIFKKILTGNYCKKNDLFFLKVWLDSYIDKDNKLVYRFIKNLLVIDYWYGDINMAFDIGFVNGMYRLDILLRNNLSCSPIIGNKIRLKFQSNKESLGFFATKEELLIKINEIFNLLREKP